MPRKDKAKESICLYSISGGGKTTQIEELARVVRETLGPDKVVRLVSANADGWTVIAPAVDAGFIIPTWIASRRYIIQTIDRFTRGWWPTDPTDPDSPLLPPSQQKDWPTVGGIAFDSGTDFADLIMRSSLEREAETRGTFRIAAESAAHTYVDGSPGERDANGKVIAGSADETRYASAARGHYGADQNRMEQFICQSKDIPERFVLWTFLEDKGKDPVTKAPVYGPDVIGSAINGKVPSWFGRTLRLAIDSKTGKRRMYTHNHYEAGDPIPYLANARDYWKAPLPLFLEDKQVSLHTFYALLKKSYESLQKGVKP